MRAVFNRARLAVPFRPIAKSTKAATKAAKARPGARKGDAGDLALIIEHTGINPYDPLAAAGLKAALKAMARMRAGAAAVLPQIGDRTVGVEVREAAARELWRQFPADLGEGARRALFGAVYGPALLRWVTEQPESHGRLDEYLSEGKG